MTDHRRAILAALLAVQGALILVGAVIVAFTGTTLFPFDALVGADASVAAIVLGAAFIMAFRMPTRTWVNLAILYEVLTIGMQFVKIGVSLTDGTGVTSIIISALFLVALLVCYPRSESVIVAPAV